MQTAEIVKAVQDKKGQHVQAVWRRDAKTKKGTAFKIEKRTCAWVRSGINYANLATVKEGIESGERGEVQPLQKGQAWLQFPFTLRNETSGQEYVRLYPATFENLRKETKTEWIMDGVVVPYEQVEQYLLASDKRKEDKETPPCFLLKSESVMEIAGE